MLQTQPNKMFCPNCAREVETLTDHYAILSQKYSCVKKWIYVSPLRDYIINPEWKKATTKMSEDDKTCPHCLEEVLSNPVEHITRDAGSQWTKYYYDCPKARKCSVCGSGKTPAKMMIHITGTKMYVCTAECLCQCLAVGSRIFTNIA